jgi:hypothetical protein
MLVILLYCNSLLNIHTLFPLIVFDTRIAMLQLLQVYERAKQRRFNTA